MANKSKTRGKTRGPKQEQGKHGLSQWQINLTARKVSSLLDNMVDGAEYASVATLVPDNVDFGGELRRAIAEVESVRKRPCVCYVGNTIGTTADGVSIEAADDLPFSEMLEGIPPGPAIDVFLSSGGGSAHQVTRFVELLHHRYESVHFLLPAASMSAATIWALSGHEIWMTNRAYLGPIDPQVPGPDGRYLPAQALLVFLQHIRDLGANELSQGRQPDWTHLQLLRFLDQRQVGAAITASKYSVERVQEYLEHYKFKSWIMHSSGQPVTEQERKFRALQVAEAFGDHNRWKAHGHAISREVAHTELQLKIEHVESVAGLERAIRRLWAVCYLLQDKARFAKMIFSGTYSFFRIGKATG